LWQHFHYHGNCRYISNAIKRYGKDSFEVTILNEGINDVEQLNELEKYWINHYKSYQKKYGYNLCLGGNGGGIKSKETLERMSIALKGKKAWNKGIPRTEEVKQKLRIAHLGKKHSEETKRKLSEKMKVRVFTKEHKKKISLACKGRIFSEEHINKMRKPKSEQHKIALSLTKLHGKVLDIKEIKKLRKEGLSLEKIGINMGVSLSTIWTRLKII
jgi:hypothetical protein